MEIQNVFTPCDGFKVLATAGNSQTALMVLATDEASSAAPNRHPHSDQVLLVIEGEVEAELSGHLIEMRRGDSIIVPANTSHRFVNRKPGRAVTFSVYAPAAYPPSAAE